MLCEAWGPPDSLQLRDIDAPEPGPKQVRIAVRACGVNFPDSLIIEGKYQFKPDFPFAPGGEVSGVVDAVGEKVKHLSVGQKVFALTGWGGFAEMVVADANAVFPIPDGMDYITAAAFVMTYGTTYHALSDRARLKEGESLLVLGAAGGVGLTAVELGTRMGAKVIAAASTEEKLALCREYGAQETINYTSEDLKSRIKELTDGKGVDVVYDPVGGDYSEAALRGMAWKGRHLVIGFASGTIPSIPLNLALLKGCQIVGVFWGSFAQRFPQKNMGNLMQVLQWYMQGHIKPHIHATYPLENSPEAIKALLRREVKGKVVVTIGPEQ